MNDVLNQGVGEGFSAVLASATRPLAIDPELRLEVTNELRTHLEEDLRARIEAGATPHVARDGALEAFGDPDALAGPLLAANRRRLAWRRVAAWSVRLLFVPLAVWVAWTALTAAWGDWRFVSHLASGSSWEDRHVAERFSGLPADERTVGTRLLSPWPQGLRDAVAASDRLVNIHANDPAYVAENVILRYELLERRHPQASAADMQTLIDLVKTGERLDPQNALFPLIHAGTLLKLSRDDEAVGAYLHAATLPYGREYGSVLGERRAAMLSNDAALRAETARQFLRSGPEMTVSAPRIITGAFVSHAGERIGRGDPSGLELTRATHDIAVALLREARTPYEKQIAVLILKLADRARVAALEGLENPESAAKRFEHVLAGTCPLPEGFGAAASVRRGLLENSFWFTPSSSVGDGFRSAEHLLVYRVLISGLAIGFAGVAGVAAVRGLVAGRRGVLTVGVAGSVRVTGVLLAAPLVGICVLWAGLGRFGLPYAAGAVCVVVAVIVWAAVRYRGGKVQQAVMRRVGDLGLTPPENLIDERCRVPRWFTATVWTVAGGYLAFWGVVGYAGSANPVVLASTLLDAGVIVGGFVALCAFGMIAGQSPGRWMLVAAGVSMTMLMFMLVPMDQRRSLPNVVLAAACGVGLAMAFLTAWRSTRSAWVAGMNVPPWVREPVSNSVDRLPWFPALAGPLAGAAVLLGGVIAPVLRAAEAWAVR